MPKIAEFDDLAGEEIYDPRVLGEIMRAERRRRGMTNSALVAGFLRSRHRIQITTRRYDDIENGRNHEIPLAVFLAFVDVVKPRGGIGFAAEAFSQSACDTLGIKKYE
jgi:hypothetical protein